MTTKSKINRIRFNMFLCILSSIFYVCVILWCYDNYKEYNITGLPIFTTILCLMLIGVNGVSYTKMFVELKDLKKNVIK